MPLTPTTPHASSPNPIPPSPCVGVRELDLEQADSTGASPLLAAIRGGHTTAVLLLLKRGARPHPYPLALPEQGRDRGESRHNARKDAQQHVRQDARQGGVQESLKRASPFTPLMLAAAKGRLRVTRALISAIAISASPAGVSRG